MELDEFVAATLNGIIRGVAAAQAEARDKHASVEINPYHEEAWGQIWATTSVEFDVAVSIAEGSERSGGAGISVWSIGGSAQQKRDRSTESATRVKFTVPLILPRGGKDVRKASEAPATLQPATPL